MAIYSGLKGGLLVEEGVHSTRFVEEPLCFGFVVGGKGGRSEVEAALGIVAVAVHLGDICICPGTGGGV